MPDTFQVERNGVLLDAMLEGNPSGPLVVFVHGYPDDKTVWNGVVSLLREEFRILRYDVRGAGFSDAPDAVEEYRMRELVLDLIAVVDAVAPDARFHVVGHDWGSIQLWEAVSEPGVKDRIKSFVSASGPSLDHVSLQLQAALRQGGVRERLRAANQAIRSWYIGFFQTPVLPELAWSARTAQWLEAGMAKSEGIPLTAFQSPRRSHNGRTGVRLYRANVPERMRAPQERRTDVPTRVLVPQNDTYVSAYIAGSCDLWATSVHIQPVEGGHWFYLSQPEVFANAIRAHVSAHD